MRKNHTERVRELLDSYGSSYTEKKRTFLHVSCPVCGQSDKFSILKTSGWCVCYRGSCEFGKRPFWEWISLTSSISIQDAKREFFGTELRVTLDPLNFDFDEKVETIETIQWPYPDTLPVNEFSLDANNYLASRGISLDMARHYQLTYSFAKRRVYFPIFIDEACYGYQARAIDNVAPSFRMLNNEGFRRDLFVMFFDFVRPKEHIIIAEGPFDALKLSVNGNAIATMGKAVTDDQIELLMEKMPTSVYLALDDDAESEMSELVAKIPVPVYIMSPPQSTYDRCKSIGKKADFGECTFQECSLAFQQSKRIRKDQIVFNL